MIVVIYFQSHPHYMYVTYALTGFHQHWAAVVSRGWAKVSACRLQVSLSYATLCRSCHSSICQGRVSIASLISLVSFYCQMVGLSKVKRGPSVVFEPVDVPCPRATSFSHFACHVFDFCPFPDPDVGISVLACEVEHRSFNFGLICAAESLWTTGCKTMNIRSICFLLNYYIELYGCRGLDTSTAHVYGVETCNLCTSLEQTFTFVLN